MVEPMVSIRGLYKIFGARAKDVLQHVKDGMGKEELLARHSHVLGLNNINVDMQAGEITVVMGLSGSGKSTLIRHLNRLIEPTVGEIIVQGRRRDGAVGRWVAQSQTRKDVDGVSKVCVTAA